LRENSGSAGAANFIAPSSVNMESSQRISLQACATLLPAEEMATRFQ
jgi:hypothetical protein